MNFNMAGDISGEAYRPQIGFQNKPYSSSAQIGGDTLEPHFDESSAGVPFGDPFRPELEDPTAHEGPQYYRSYRLLSESDPHQPSTPHDQRLSAQRIIHTDHGPFRQPTFEPAMPFLASSVAFPIGQEAINMDHIFTDSTGRTTSCDRASPSMLPPAPPRPLANGPIREEHVSTRTRISEAEWAVNREIIKTLYIDENQTLATTMSIMKERHGFRASYVIL